MNVGKKNIILAVILCASITVIGISFAYFSSSVLVGGTGSSVSGNAGELIKVSYDAGSKAINLTNAIPGSSDSKDFSVTVTPTTTENAATYAINLDISANTFETCDSSNQTADNNCTIGAEELTYTLRNENGVVASGNLTEQTGTITILKETKTVSEATVYNYTLEITYVDTNSDQNHNMNKTFTGSLNVEFAEP